MAKVITFSRTFPVYHPKKGQPTFFVEKFLKSLAKQAIPSFISKLDSILNIDQFDKSGPKDHTIRAGHRFKSGDYFSPRVWGDDINPKTGRKGPYHSKQIILAPDILIIKTWDFTIDPLESGRIYLDGKHLWKDFENKESDSCFDIANNDGLSVEDLLAWFKHPKPFDGQIICWNKEVNY